MNKYKIILYLIGFSFFLFLSKAPFYNINIKCLNEFAVDSTDWKYWDVVNEQVVNFPTKLKYSDKMHESKMEVRLTLPLLIKFFKIDIQKRPKFLFILELVLLFVSIILLYFHFISLKKEPVFVFLIFSTLFGTMYLFDHWPMGDPIAFFCGICLITSKIRIFNSILATWGLFTDERFIFIIIIKFIVEYLNANSIVLDYIKKHIWSSLLLIFPYLVLRYFLWFFYDLKSIGSSRSNDISIFMHYEDTKFFTIAAALVLWLKGFWYLIYLYLKELVKRGKYQFLILFILILLLFILGAFAVADFSRTLNYGFLIVLIPLLDKYFEISRKSKILIIIVCLIFPDFDFHVPMNINLMGIYNESLKQNFILNLFTFFS